jgi:hypothetical protein
MQVRRSWDTSKLCPCPCTGRKKISFDVSIQKNSEYRRDSDEPEGYLIEAKREFSFFPSGSTRKLYYGTFEGDIFAQVGVVGNEKVIGPDASAVGKISTNLNHKKLGIDLPGITFPERLNVYHKAVLFGTLLVNVIRD